MGIDVFDTIALTLYANDNNKITGRTAIQKLIYFHTMTVENLHISDYVHYFYGPFSHYVANALESMSEFSFIDRRVISSYYETYEYELTRKGIEYAKDAKRKYLDEFETISQIVQICKEYNGLTSTSLSYAAKAHYILAKSGNGHSGYSAKDVREIAKDFDWEISPDDAQNGLELLQKLDLVSCS